ncbi:hypothetical protein [Maritalea myrionectae]|uniref:Uncharacterized protein n=1 Tax=Maritalea myrionectae TaxID=454601 RepID=A0A2R4MFQ3_9HYPH|nr:hypothetical protein [Maritalea myrionectae]AVX04868.1 hypothetical protein MXMO3_02355 [Maritalea myrionectae]
MAEFLFYFWLFLLLLVVIGWPSWPYTRERWPYKHGGNYRYAVSGMAAALAILFWMLFWFGLVAIAWPWTAPPPAT